MGIHKRHISSYSAHVNGRVEKPNQSLANILASISQNTNDWDEQLPHTMLALNSAIHEATYTSPFFLEHGRDIRLSYTYEKNSDTPQNKYEYVEKLLPSLEQIFNKVLNNLKDQEASHVDLSTRATKQHHYDYKIGSLCFIKTPNIKSNLSPKLRPKFEGPYRPDGRGYELVSSVRALVPQKFSVEEELMHVKHVDVKSPHVGVMWKFGRGVISSGIVLVT
ncbi:integrase catalytic domain-containing protein [Trichonephila clavipes]|nr:integrase catalytic domain-containing protein [Trichonephila clavipes]